MPRPGAAVGLPLLVTVRGTRRGIPAATLAMPIQIRGAMDLAGLRFGHAVFRCMGDGWPQQHHNCNGDSTHVLNTHDREPYQFTGQTERRAKLGQRDIARALRPSTSGNVIPAWVGHNETCALSLMSRIWVNSGTVPRRALRRPGRWWWCLLPSPSARFCGPVVEIPDARNRLLARIFSFDQSMMGMRQVMLWPFASQAYAP